METKIPPKPKVPTGIHKFLLNFFFGYTIVQYNLLVLKNKSLWIPICEKNRDHWYQERIARNLEQSKKNMDQWVKDVLKIDWKIMHKRFDI